MNAKTVARAFIGASAFICGLSACHPIGQAQSGHGIGMISSTIPHVLRYATDEDIVGLNPWFNSQLTLTYMAEMSMAWLFRYDHHNEPIPELATVYPSQANGGISSDGRTITFHLRHGVQWSDGAPFRADDVVFSIHQILNPKNNIISRDGWDRIDRIEEPDAYTVRLHLTRPYAEFEPTFFSTGGANPCILPKHLLEHVASLNDASYNALPIGIGPFKYLRWDRANRVVLVPNERYFRGRPKLDRVEFHIIPDPSTLLTQLQVGELDLWIPARAYYIDRLEHLVNYRVARQSSYLFSHLDFNLKNPIFADRRVRYALRAAIDRGALREKISHGIGIVQESYLSPDYPNAPKPIPAQAFDLAKANRLLDEAGWQRGSDGIRVKNGQRMDFNFALGPPSADILGAIELLRKWWGEIGVTFEVHNYGTGLFFGTYQSGGIIQRGKYDLTMFSWQVDALDNMLDILGCRSIPPNGQNNTQYCNPQADHLMEAFNATYDRKKQRRLKAQLMEIFVADAPLVVLRVSENLYVANRDLKGFDPNQVSAFDDMMHVDI